MGKVDKTQQKGPEKEQKSDYRCFSEYNFKIKSIEKKDDVIYYKIEKDGELFTVLFLFKEDRNIAYMLEPYTSDNLKEGKVIYSMHKVSNKN